jgi:UDP-2,3-diacylglucosamine pyrophosphatase LpxH
MAVETDDRVYYVVSDLHIGGDEQLEEVPFLDELLEFLTDLEATDENVELVINGDAFGLWEFTSLEGVEKFDALLEAYPELFEQLRATGETIDITLLPGNHDYELAAYDEFVDLFGAYNVSLERGPELTRDIGDSVIHFEHGNQRDENNQISDWGNPHETPIGYYYTTQVISRAGKLSDRGRFNWLKDVQAVTPTERMPVWLLSKYFYREMHPLLRYSLLPFLLLFNVSALLAVLAGLDIAGIWSAPVEQFKSVFQLFGFAGTAAWVFIGANVAVAGLLLFLGIPLYFVRRDVRQTVNRFGLFETALTVDAASPYKEAAREIFEADPETKLFCYGHTHRPTVQSVGDGLIVNSGTWLKRLHRRDGIVGILLPVFYPSYQLAAVRIAECEAGIAVEFDEIDKPSPSPEELTLTERVLTVGRAPDTDFPDRHVLDTGAEAVEQDTETVRTKETA